MTDYVVMTRSQLDDLERNGPEVHAMLDRAYADALLEVGPRRFRLTARGRAAIAARQPGVSIDRSTGRRIPRCPSCGSFAGHRAPGRTCVTAVPRIIDLGARPGRRVVAAYRGGDRP